MEVIKGLDGTMYEQSKDKTLPMTKIEVLKTAIAAKWGELAPLDYEKYKKYRQDIMADMISLIELAGQERLNNVDEA